MTTSITITRTDSEKILSALESTGELMEATFTIEDWMESSSLVTMHMEDNSLTPIFKSVVGKFYPKSGLSLYLSQGGRDWD